MLIAKRTPRVLRPLNRLGEINYTHRSWAAFRGFSSEGAPLQGVGLIVVRFCWPVSSTARGSRSWVWNGADGGRGGEAEEAREYGARTLFLNKWMRVSSWTSVRAWLVRPGDSSGRSWSCHRSGSDRGSDSMSAVCMSWRTFERIHEISYFKMRTTAMGPEVLKWKIVSITLQHVLPYDVMIVMVSGAKSRLSCVPRSPPRFPKAAARMMPAELACVLLSETNHRQVTRCEDRRWTWWWVAVCELVTMSTNHSSHPGKPCLATNAPIISNYSEVVPPATSMTIYSSELYHLFFPLPLFEFPLPMNVARCFAQGKKHP